MRQAEVNSYDPTDYCVEVGVKINVFRVNFRSVVEPITLKPITMAISGPKHKHAVNKKIQRSKDFTLLSFPLCNSMCILKEFTSLQYGESVL